MARLGSMKELGYVKTGEERQPREGDLWVNGFGIVYSGGSNYKRHIVVREADVAIRFKVTASNEAIPLSFNGFGYYEP